MKRYAIIVAGGKGLRMGGEVPKQFLQIGDTQPVLMHTLETFNHFDSEMRLIVVLPADQQGTWQELCHQYGCDIAHQIVTGGETRFHSVKNGLAVIPDETDAVVGVHDGVRPFVSQEVLQRCFELAEEKRAVIPVVPVVETIRKLVGYEASITVNRNVYRLVQTPQVFNVSLLKQAYSQPYTNAFTDDASVVEALGQQIWLTEGNRENIKLTTPFDLKIAEILLK
ncbi:MAG: 2-C-methyl-D-erythritol 4-phosphate cytidylyltransferase [Bacteroidaceae bacterium]|nr:2-C-methyl-D-erythritol 4-phosphate cytidylyltransferase [Bacteroidaceae bacterium]